MIISVEIHKQSKFPEWKQPNTFDALADESRARLGERYPTRKLLEILIVRQIAPRLAGSGVILDTVNPGLCHSELVRDVGLLLAVLKFFLARSTDVGSRTLVAAAEAGLESHGKYMTDANVDDAALSQFVKSLEGKQAAEKVWRELEEILEAIQPGVTRNLDC